MQFHLDRANRKEIAGSTERNYLKSIKLFCEITDILISSIKNPFNNTLNEEKILYHNNENNAKEFPNTVTTVTTKNKAKVVDYDILSNLPDNLYRLYEKLDTLGCNNCNDT